MQHFVSLAELTTTAFENRENSIEHFLYEQEMKMYHHMQEGDSEAVLEDLRHFSMDNSGRLSSDPLHNRLYHMIAGTTLACRFAIVGGMDPVDAFNASDLYIQKAEQCKTQEEVQHLNRDMLLFYTEQMAGVKKRAAVSKPVRLVNDYIEAHVQEEIVMDDLTEHSGLSSSYLSSLYKKETGITITEAIIEKKVSVAKSLLRFTDYSITEISEYLAFNTPSYFNRVFKSRTGVNPGDFRKQTTKGDLLFDRS